MTHKERSNHIVQWIKEHPLININLLCQMAGAADSSFFSRAINHKGRLVSRLHIDAIENVLAAYGFKPLKNQPEAK